MTEQEFITYGLVFGYGVFCNVIGFIAGIMSK